MPKLSKKKSKSKLKADAAELSEKSQDDTTGDAGVPVPEIPSTIVDAHLNRDKSGIAVQEEPLERTSESERGYEYNEKDSQMQYDPNFPLPNDALSSHGSLSFKEEKGYTSSFVYQAYDMSAPTAPRTRHKGAYIVPQDMYEDEMSETRELTRRKWRSNRLRAGEVYEKPWLKNREPRKLYEKLFFLGGCFVGLCIGGYLCYTSWISVTNSEYCLILYDNFTAGINESVWNYEVQFGGFGKGSFEWATRDESNIYVDGKGLHINPTLTVNTTTLTTAELLNGAILNLTAAGTCTSDDLSDCAVYSNSSAGTIIPSVRSARITTSGKKTIKYGKVEVEAKMPIGDWLWPSIWMLPEDNVYGDWPLSGEIDIASSRGNAAGYEGSGRDVVQSTLHWGPNGDDDAYWRTNGAYTVPRTDFAAGFHTFGLEWSPNYMFMFLDSRLLQVFFIKFSEKETFWERGDFGANTNQSALVDPWSYTGRPSTPFDQYFYLILDVAVGGTDGWFPDYEGDKPWVDDNSDAPLAFWEAVAAWYPTWGDGDTVGMTIKSVKMWSLGACSNSTD